MAGIGVVLGIAMGVDLVTREKESKSLKSLLAYPVFRDEMINGKAPGASAHSRWGPFWSSPLRS